MKHHVDIQNVSSIQSIPSAESLQSWVDMTLANLNEAGEVCIRIVDKAESNELNNKFRQKSGPTNVLSFPASIPAGVTLQPKPLGDVVICAPLLEEEAREQNLSQQAHWAHIVIHGMLHLLGYDHITKQEAHVMQGLEIDMLQRLGHKSPYGEVTHE